MSTTHNDCMPGTEARALLEEIADWEWVTTIILPKDNEKDLADIPKAVLDVLKLHLVESMDEVLKIALTEPLTALIPSEDQTDSHTTDDQITH